MKTVELSEAEGSEKAIRAGQSEEVIVTQQGTPVALVVPFDSDDLEWYARERDPEFIKSIAQAREEFKQGKWVSHEQLKSELGL